MPLISDQQLSTWSQAPSPTETARCDNVVSMIKKAVAASDRLASRGIEVFAQGSYANRTNVRQDSDVDVAVVCSDTFFMTFRPTQMTSLSASRLPLTRTTSIAPICGTL